MVFDTLDIESDESKMPQCCTYANASRINIIIVAEKTSTTALSSALSKFNFWTIGLINKINKNMYKLIDIYLSIYLQREPKKCRIQLVKFFWNNILITNQVLDTTIMLQNIKGHIYLNYTHITLQTKVIIMNWQEQ